MRDLIAADYLLRLDSGTTSVVGPGTQIAQVDGGNGAVTLGTKEKFNALSCALNVTSIVTGAGETYEWVIKFSTDNFANSVELGRKFITAAGVQDNFVINPPAVSGTVKVRYEYVQVGAAAQIVTSSGTISIHRP